MTLIKFNYNMLIPSRKTVIQLRYFQTSHFPKGKPTPQLILNLDPPTLRKKRTDTVNNNKELQSLLNFYKTQMVRDFEALKSVEPRIIQSKSKEVSVDAEVLNTYTQLPDDSQYIELHYKHLIHFRNYLSELSLKESRSKVSGKDESSSNDAGKTAKFADYESSELLKHLHHFIVSKLELENIRRTGSEAYVLKLIDGEDEDEVNLADFAKLLIDVKITLNLNCNHTFILDTLLYNKEIFDDVDKKIQQKRHESKKPKA